MSTAMSTILDARLLRLGHPGSDLESVRTQTGWRATTTAAHCEAVERVIWMMRERYQDPLTLQDMADAALLSPFHFNRVFRQITGIPPCRFLASLRLEAAKRLLLTTSVSVTDLCFDVGYNSLGSFTAHFTELVGFPPNRLRRLARDIRLPCGLAEGPVSAELAGPCAGRVGVSGRVTADEAFRGNIFLGLFPRPLPQGRSAGCSLVSGPGPFRIPAAQEGRYHIFAAGFAPSDNPVHYLLADASVLRIGAAVSPVQVRNDGCRGCADVVLRAPRLVDPPILIALPLILAERLDRYSRNVG